MTKSPLANLCNCLAMRQATRLITVLYDRHLVQAGLSTSQFSILAAIYAAPGIDMQELSDQMVMERTSLVRAIKPLSRDGWVQQLPSPENSRKLVFSLSEEGVAKYQEARPHWAQAQAEFEASVGQERAAALRTELNSLARDAA